MKGKLIILMVCAALANVSLVEISPATAAIPKETIDDIHLMRIYQDVSILQVKKVIQCIFPKNLQDYLAKGGLSDGDSNEGHLTEIETCTNILLVRGIGVIDATMSVATIVDPQTSPAITSAHTPAVNGLIDLFTDVCTALKLAATKHSSTTAAKIQAMADKQISAATSFNKPYFDAIRASRNFQPGMENMFRKCERRSSSAIVNAFNETFNGIQEFASLGGLEGESEEISSTFDTFRERAISENVACLEAKFDIAETVFTSFKIIQFGVQNLAVTVSRENQNFTMTAALETEKGISAVFNTILSLLAKASPNNQTIPEINSSDIIEAGRAVTSAAYANALENIVREFPPNDTESISAPIKEAASALQKAVDGVYMTIQKAQGNNSCELLPKLAGIEDIETRNFAEMSLKLYDAIRRSPKYNVEMEPTLVRIQNVSISNSNGAAADIFKGIKTLADANCPGIQTSSIDNLSLVTAEYRDAFSKLEVFIRSLSDAVTSISDE